MDPNVVNVPVVQPPASPAEVPPSGTQEGMPAPVPPAKKSNLLLILGIVLLVFSLLALAGYLAYQNYQLKNQITVTPKPLTEASPLPTAGVDCGVSQEVRLCEGNITETDSMVPGSGIVYQKPDGTKINCPVVSPDYETQECKDIEQLKSQCFSKFCSTPSSSPTSP